MSTARQVQAEFRIRCRGKRNGCLSLKKLDRTRRPCENNLPTKRIDTYGSALQKISQYVKARAGRSTGSLGCCGLRPKASRPGLKNPVNPAESPPSVWRVYPVKKKSNLIQIFSTTLIFTRAAQLDASVQSDRERN